MYLLLFLDSSYLSEEPIVLGIYWYKSYLSEDPFTSNFYL